MPIASWAGTCANAQRTRKERESLSPYGHAERKAHATRTRTGHAQGTRKQHTALTGNHTLCDGITSKR
ncbi:hypothetical protein [Scytonema sp. PCC 10023]|uniref:hypothetical protein n=1 Tax=Scytonema sp. PCC 10023 TaxID=1680591 RepID=UPI0039C679FB